MRGIFEALKCLFRQIHKYDFRHLKATHGSRPYLFDGKQTGLQIQQLWSRLKLPVRVNYEARHAETLDLAKLV